MRRLLALAVMMTVVTGIITACGSTGQSDEADPSPSSTRAEQLSTSGFVEKLGECVVALGWDVEYGSDSLTPNIPEAQRTAFERDLDLCREEVGEIPPPTLDAELAKSEYLAQERFRECLVDHGIDPPELPSYQKFEDDLLIGGVIYDLAYEAGLNPGDSLRVTCADPMNTWGNNG